jgi:hypothetical protein
MIADRTGWTPPVVTVASLVEAAAEHAAARRWAHADALLLHAAMHADGHRLATYRAVLSAMELLDGAGRAANLDALAEIAETALAVLRDELTNGPAT